MLELLIALLPTMKYLELETAQVVMQIQIAIGATFRVFLKKKDEKKKQSNQSNAKSQGE